MKGWNGHRRNRMHIVRAFHTYFHNEWNTPCVPLHHNRDNAAREKGGIRGGGRGRGAVPGRISLEEFHQSRLHTWAVSDPIPIEASIWKGEINEISLSLFSFSPMRDIVSHRSNRSSLSINNWREGNSSLRWSWSMHGRWWWWRWCLLLTTTQFWYNIRFNQNQSIIQGLNCNSTLPNVSPCFLSSNCLYNSCFLFSNSNNSFSSTIVIYNGMSQYLKGKYSSIYRTSPVIHDSIDGWRRRVLLRDTCNHPSLPSSPSSSLSHLRHLFRISLTL